MSATTPTPNSDKASTHRLEQAGASDSSITAIHQQLLREKPEPVEGFSPIPIFLLFVFSALIFSAGIYIARFSGEFSPLAFSPAQGRVKAGGSAAAGPVDLRKMGERLFQQCAPCHQMTGLGLPGVYPPLAGSEFILGNEQRIIRILLLGLNGPVAVKGNTFNGSMPAFGPHSGYRFNEQKIAAVLTYVRSNWGNNAPEVKPETVKAVMTAIGGRTDGWTAPELEPFK